jgi:hypothetical protein
MLQDKPPTGDQFTAYDRQHAKTYLRLLDAEAAGASWQVVVRKLFKLDPGADPERLQRMHAAHLARAQWLRDGGYKHLLQ